MLKNTFQHISGIGSKVEKQLWLSGLTDWRCFTKPIPKKLNSKKVDKIADCINESFENIDNCNPRYFSDLLPAKEHWRFFPEFRKTTAYIDIETTGLEWGCTEITTIALYDGQSIKYYIQQQNLDDFLDDIEQYDVIITYNGKTFDVPNIEAYWGIELKQAHIDLRYVLKSLGYGGGLKSCEKALGIGRGDLDGVDGFFAVLLWNDYQKNNNEKALETLLAYNIEDVVNLETLMIMAYNLKIKDTPFYKTHQLKRPQMPKIPFKPDLKTIKKLKIEMYGSEESYW